MLAGGLRGSGQHPGAVLAGQVPGEEVAQVEAPPAAAGDLGDDAPDAGAVLAVVLAQGWPGGPVRPGTAQQRVVLVQVKGAPVSGGRAPLAQRAGAAGGAEDDRAPGGDGAGDGGWAGHGAGVLIDGEVAGGEPALNSRLERPGLDDQLVPGSGEGGPQVAGTVGGITVDLRRRRFPGDHLRGDRRVAVSWA